MEYEQEQDERKCAKGRDSRSNYADSAGQLAVTIQHDYIQT